MALGSNGGQISPAVYDTAQLLRFAPPDNPRPAWDWLMAQQHPDGGWGDPVAPRARTVPTLAAVLALHQSPLEHTLHSIESGIRYLVAQTDDWAGPLPNDIPVGVELILPTLLLDARKVGLVLPESAYTAVEALGQHRRALIANREHRSGTAPVHSWEAWGNEPDPALLDASGGIGHSPAATAYWLSCARDRPEFIAACNQATRYLQQSEQATGCNIAGVVPTVWPINRFEQIFALYFLVISGMHRHPELATLVTQQVADLAKAMRPDGIGMSDAFMVDGDITTTAASVLAVLGSPVATSILARFQTNQHFFTYPGELQPSLTTTAHAAHALSQTATGKHAQDYLLHHQNPDGYWQGDKWHSAWFYTTSQVLVTLGQQQQAHRSHVNAALSAIQQYQHPCGGWGIDQPTTEETAYALLSFLVSGQSDHPAVERGYAWLGETYAPSATHPSRWIGKELYCPTRLVSLIEGCLLLRLSQYQGQDRAVGGHNA